MRFSSSLSLSSATLFISLSSIASGADTQSDTPSRRSAAVPAYPACTHEPTDNDISAAKGAYQAGQVSFQEADYDHALLYWEDAFRRDCTAIKLLLNIARAYELSGARVNAIGALRTYLERQPNQTGRDSIEKRVAKLQERVDQENKDKVVEAPPPQVQPKPAPNPPPKAEPLESKKPLWPIFVTGGGVVASTVGVVLSVTGQSSFKKIAEENGCDADTKTCDSDGETEAIKNNPDAISAKTRRDFGTGLAITGGAVAIAGGALWYWIWSQKKHDHNSKVPAGLTVQPVIGSRYQGLSLNGSF